MVTVIEGNNSWAEFGSNLGKGASEAYEQRADQLALQKAVESLPPNAPPQEVIKAITGAKTYNKSAQQDAIKNVVTQEEITQARAKAADAKRIEDARTAIQKDKAEKTVANQANAVAAQERRNTALEEKNAQAKAKIEYERNQNETKKNEERVAADRLIDQLALPPEQKESLKGALPLKDAADLFKEQQKVTDEKLTPFEKALQNKNAEEYVQLTKDIPKLNSVLEDVNYAKKLADEMGVLGIAGSLVNLSGKGKELENVTFTMMEPIVKIFNPSGPIAQAKLKTIQDKYVVKGSDAPWTKKAKLDTIERFTKQALSRATKRMELFQKYDGNPPVKEVEKFDTDSDTISDAMIDYDLQAEEVKLEGMPAPKSFKGKTVTSPDGQKYFSDGTRWVKK